MNDKWLYVLHSIEEKLNDENHHIDMQIFLTIFHLLDLNERLYFLNMINENNIGSSFVKEILMSYHNRTRELEYLLNGIGRNEEYQKFLA